MFNSIKKLFNSQYLNYCNLLIQKDKNITLNEKVCFTNLFEFNELSLSSELLDPNKNSKRIIFSIYTKIYKNYDKFLFESSQIESNLIILNSGFIGREYNKTYSFSNTKNGEQKPILFEIVSGEGYILIQNLEDITSEIKIIKIKKNNIILIEKNFSFTIINSSRENLIIFSFREDGCQFNFNILKTYNGNLVYFTKKGFIKNNNSKGDYILHEFEGDYPNDLSFHKKNNLYFEFRDLPAKFNFLKE